MERKSQSTCANPNQPSQSKSMVGIVVGILLGGLLMVGYQWLTAKMAPPAYTPGTVSDAGVYTSTYFGLQYTPPHPVWLLLDESHIQAAKDQLAGQPGSEALLAIIEPGHASNYEHCYIDDQGANLLVRVGGAFENGPEALLRESWKATAAQATLQAELRREPYPVTVAGLPGWGMDSRLNSGDQAQWVEQQVRVVEKDGMVMVMTLTSVAGGSVEDLQPYWDSFVPLQ